MMLHVLIVEASHVCSHVCFDLCLKRLFPRPKLECGGRDSDCEEDKPR